MGFVILCEFAVAVGLYFGIVTRGVNHQDSGRFDQWFAVQGGMRLIKVTGQESKFGCAGLSLTVGPHCYDFWGHAHNFGDVGKWDSPSREPR